MARAILYLITTVCDGKICLSYFAMFVPSGIQVLCESVHLAEIAPVKSTTPEHDKALKFTLIFCTDGPNISTLHANILCIQCGMMINPQTPLLEEKRQCGHVRITCICQKLWLEIPKLNVVNTVHGPRPIPELPSSHEHRVSQQSNAMQKRRRTAGRLLCRPPDCHLFTPRHHLNGHHC